MCVYRRDYNQICNTEEIIHAIELSEFIGWWKSICYILLSNKFQLFNIFYTPIDYRVYLNSTPELRTNKYYLYLPWTLKNTSCIMVTFNILIMCYLPFKTNWNCSKIQYNSSFKSLVFSYFSPVFYLIFYFRILLPLSFDNSTILWRQHFSY